MIVAMAATATSRVSIGCRRHWLIRDVKAWYLVAKPATRLNFRASAAGLSRRICCLPPLARDVEVTYSELALVAP